VDHARAIGEDVVTGLRLITAGMCIALAVACGPGDPPAATAPSRSGKACGGSLDDKKVLRIGVQTEQPGIGEIVDGDRNRKGRRGFDIDVATYIAEKLDAEIDWRDAFPPDRERLLQECEVDLVVASYTISRNRMEKVSFAGPYVIYGQDIMVRASDATTITGLDDLADKKVCVADNSTSAVRLVQEFGKAWDVPEHIVRMASSRHCVTAPLDDTVDAVSTGNLILAGYVAEQPGRLHLVDRPFTVDNVGVGLPRGNCRDVEEVNDILQEMIDDGTWEKKAREHFGSPTERALADLIIKNKPTPGVLAESWLIPRTDQPAVC
jgi:glutamate transport system substrate-binding protein